MCVCACVCVCVSVSVCVRVCACLHAAVDNGLNPVWSENCVFDVLCPELALLRFAVMDEDIFGDPNFLGQACYPVPCIRSGGYGCGEGWGGQWVNGCVGVSG